MTPRLARGRIAASRTGRRAWARVRIGLSKEVGPHPATRRLVIKSIFGMANRLRYLLTAKAFADRWGLQLCPDWREGWYGPPGENSFFELFELDGAAEPPAEWGAVYPPSWEGRTELTAYQWMEEVKREQGERAMQRDLMYPFYRVLVERPAAETLINSGWLVVPQDLPVAGMNYNPRRVNEALRPSARCREAIAAELPPLAGCVGVHVRRTDSPNQLPLEAYFQLVGDDNRPIFLCTDSADVEREFRTKYGDRLLSIHRHYHADGGALHHGGFDSADGDESAPDRRRLAVEAVRDLYGLGGCGRIVHGGNSSYSQFAVDVLAAPDADVRLAT